MATALREIESAAQVQALVQREIENAVDFSDNEIGPDRDESLAFFRGEKFGNEEDGRSQVVWRVVQDAVREILPSLMRVFFGSENAVEYTPVGPEDVAGAEQATDYAKYVVLQDNPGVAEFLDVFNDSLYQKSGTIKVWRDESIEVTYETVSGLDDAAVAILLTAEDGLVEVVPDTLETTEQGHSFTVRHTRRSPRIRLAAVPPEEFLINARARSLEDATYIGHRTLKTVAEVAALGIDPAMIAANITDSDHLDGAREREQSDGIRANHSMNPAAQRVLYVESYMKMDLDGDGIHELRKFVTLGEGHEVVNGDGLGEPVSFAPFANFCPFPEPHKYIGSDVADRTKDLQLIQSQIVRLIMDSLAFSIHNRTAYVEGKVNREDLDNTEVGANIGMDAPGMIQPIIHPFTGAAAMPVLAMVQAEADKRVGVHNMALEADALQSTTKAAVNAQVDAARQTLELIARLYAEVGMKRFYSLLLKLIVAHQDKPRTVRIRGEWVSMDPRSWNANMDVTVNVGLGNGLTEERLNSLRELGKMQQTIMSSLGPNNDAVGLGHVTHTMSKVAELSGWADTSQFVNKLPLEYKVQMPPPPPDPAQILAQIEGEKTQADMLMDAMRLAFDYDELFADTLLEAAKIRASGGTVDLEQIRQSLKADELL